MGAICGCAALHGTHRTLTANVAEVLGKARIRIAWASSFFGCGHEAGIAFRWEWGWGRYPLFGCPSAFRPTRHARLTRTLPHSGVEPQLAEGKGGPTSTFTRKEGCPCEITVQVCAPHSHPCSSQCAIEHARAPDLSPRIHHVVAWEAFRRAIECCARRIADLCFGCLCCQSTRDCVRRPSGCMLYEGSRSRCTWSWELVDGGNHKSSKSSFQISMGVSGAFRTVWARARLQRDACCCLLCPLTTPACPT